MKTSMTLALTAAFLCGGSSPSRAGPLAGGNNGAGFVFTFDEYGLAEMSLNGAPPERLYGALMPDPVEGGMSLTYLLPELVNSGDVRIFDPSLDLPQDLLRFTDAFGTLNGGLNADRLIFYSDRDDEEQNDFPGLADRDFSVRFANDGDGVFEVGYEGKNGAYYISDPNNYHAISDGHLPEPATWTLALVGLSALGALGYRRSRRAKPVLG